jgi:hypothetical protein
MSLRAGHHMVENVWVWRKGRTDRVLSGISSGYSAWYAAVHSRPGAMQIKGWQEATESGRTETHDLITGECTYAFHRQSSGSDTTLPTVTERCALLTSQTAKESLLALITTGAEQTPAADRMCRFGGKPLSAGVKRPEQCFRSDSSSRIRPRGPSTSADSVGILDHWDRSEAQIIDDRRVQSAPRRVRERNK